MSYGRFSFSVQTLKSAGTSSGPSSNYVIFSQDKIFSDLRREQSLDDTVFGQRDLEKDNEYELHGSHKGQNDQKRGNVTTANPLPVHVLAQIVIFLEIRQMTYVEHRFGYFLTYSHVFRGEVPADSQRGSRVDLKKTLPYQS